MTGDLAPRVVVVGVSPCIDRYGWFDSFELGVPNRPRRVEARPGGKAMNAARVLRALGVAVTVVAPLDRAEWAWWVKQSAEEGIELVPTPAVGLVRMTMTCIDEVAGRATEIYEPNTAMPLDEWRGVAEAVTHALAGAEPPLAVAVSGSRPAADGGALASIVERCQLADVPVYVDGYGSPVLGALAARPTVLKVNLDEARRLLGGGADLDPPGAAEALVAAGPRIAVVTAGARGGACFDGKQHYRIAPPNHPAPFPGGSGDAFLAGLIAARVVGRPLEIALEYARHCGEANATSPYAGWVPPDLGPVAPS